jgi:hypothetical protein
MRPYSNPTRRNMEDNLNILEMENDLRFLKMVDELKLLVNGRRPNFFLQIEEDLNILLNGRPPHFFYSSNGRQTHFVLQ